MYIAHEQVYSPFLLLIWKDKDLHSNVIPILGGFHRLRVLQKIPHKRYQCIQDKDGLFIQRLLHQNQRNEVLKDGITFSLCVCTRKHMHNCSNKSRITHQKHQPSSFKVANRIAKITSSCTSQRNNKTRCI